MKFKFKYTDKIVGVFVFVALGLLIGLMALIVVVNQKVFIKKHFFTTRFTDAGDLKNNQDIFFKGFRIGKIRSYRLNEANQIDVKFFIYHEYINRITSNSVLNKGSNPLTGAKITLIPNEFNTIIPPDGSFIPSLDIPEGKQLLAKGEVKKEADQISSIIKSVEEVLNNVNEITSSINSDNNADQNSVARILVNSADTIAEAKKSIRELNLILANFKKLSDDMKDADGLAQRLVDPDGSKMFNSIKDSLDSLALTMDNLAKFTAFINGQSRQIETLLLESKNTMKEAQDVIEGIKNNPLIKGGITEKKEIETIKETIRDRNFE